MEEFRIGEIQVQGTLELEEPFIPMDQLFPDADAKAIAAHRSRLEPWYDRQDDTWLRRLVAAGIHPECINFVLSTHLHLDHCGWHTRLVDGRWVPTFANATYLFTREEFEHRQAVADSTFDENIAPVMEAGQGVIVAMDHALDHEVWLPPTPGHTPGHVSIILASKGHRAVIMGDVMHSPVQCAEPDWRAVSDRDPVGARATRHGFLKQLPPLPNITFRPGECQTWN